ncbi:MAG: hypothetical protein ABIR55_03785, partial [Burkholderiaceae bacterium]
MALLILLAALESQALTLGRVQGAALIGRPLVVSVAVQPDPGQTLSSSCFEADVFHGDSKQDASHVKVRLEPAASGQGSVLRVTSDNPVNEPVVTVYLRVGCDQAISRRYVMLADIVSEQAAPVGARVGVVPLVLPGPVTPGSAGQTTRAAPSTVAAAGSGASAARANTSNVPSGSAPVRASARPAPATKRPAKLASARPAAAKPAPVVKPVPAKPAAPAAANLPDDKAGAGRAAGQSRLRLDPLELLSERVATLETVNANAPVEAAAREARDAQRLDNLETSVKSLVALAAKNEASLLELRSRLERAQAERYSNPVVYLLLALLLASLMAIAFLMSRSSRRAREESDDKWWDGSGGRQATAAQAVAPVEVPAADGGPDSGLSAISESSPLSQPVGLAQPERASVQQTQPMTQSMPMRHAGAIPAQVDVSLVEMSESTFDRLMQSGTAHSAVRKPRDDEPTSISPGQAPGASFAGVAGASVRARRIDSDELVDIRQRAEFFVSLGQTDQAVQVLEARIAQDRDSCPQAYLDLLKLFHSLGLKADFLQVRGDFSRIFNVRIPEFADFDDEGLGLEDYPGTVDRLIAVWNRPSVLDVIEHLLYLQEGDTAHQPFDLAGLRDLLMLHSVAQVVRGGDASDSGAFGAHSYARQTGSAVDIDLSELIDASAPAASGLFDTASGATTARKLLRTGNLIDFDLTEIPLDGKKPET